jgi:hypothetical protein
MLGDPLTIFVVCTPDAFTDSDALYLYNSGFQKLSFRQYFCHPGNVGTEIHGQCFKWGETEIFVVHDEAALPRLVAFKKPDVVISNYMHETDPPNKCQVMLKSLSSHKKITILPSFLSILNTVSLAVGIQKPEKPSRNDHPRIRKPQLTAA